VKGHETGSKIVYSKTTRRLDKKLQTRGGAAEDANSGKIRRYLLDKKRTGVERKKQAKDCKRRKTTHGNFA